VSQLEARLTSELPLARTNLVGREPELFSVVDRLRSEGLFRAAVANALFGLVLVLGLRVGPVAAAITFVAAVVLLLQGAERNRESNAALIEAIRLERTTAPSLVHVQALVDSLPASEEGARTT